MQSTALTYLIVCPLVFLAGFVDAVAGGGGIISLPAYLLAGIPVKLAAGTNKFANSFGTGLAVIRYAKSSRIDWYCAIPAALGALCGSAIGSSFALMLSDRTLQIVIITVLPIAALVVLLIRHRTDADVKTLAPSRIIPVSMLIGLAIGSYDGLIGPGSGTFYTIAFSVFLGFGLLKSSGCARLTNLASNVSALFVYLLNGDVLFSVGIPAIACSMLGNYLGARYAIKGGSRKILPVMFLVLGLLFLKTVLSMAGVIDF